MVEGIENPNIPEDAKQPLLEIMCDINKSTKIL